MTGVPVRVAVQPGASTVRVAGAEADGPPWLVAELPGPDADVSALLAELVGPAPEELVLVHPGSWARRRVEEWVAQCSGLAGCVRAVPAPLAAAGRGGMAVLDVGAAGAEAVRLGPAGTVLEWRQVDVGGRRLDELVAAWLAPDAPDDSTDAARRVREALSLLPQAGGMRAADLREVLAGPLGAVVAAVREVLTAAGPAPVLLVGGVARSPLLAELLDEAGVVDVSVAPRPDAAAVLGALALPPAPRVGEFVRASRAICVRESGDECLPTDPLAGGAGADPDGSAPRWLPPLPPPRRRRLRAALLAAAAALAVAVLVAASRALAPDTPAAAPSGVLVQYGYRFDVPTGWEHTGGLPPLRRVLLTPIATPDGSDLIAVESSPLGYDTGAEPQRAQAELRAEFDAAVADGAALSAYRPDVRFAGRTVTTYRQEEADGTAVEWFVVLDGDTQLSVGCRHTPSGAQAVRAACALVVASLRRT